VLPVSVPFQPTLLGKFNPLQAEPFPSERHLDDSNNPLVAYPLNIFPEPGALYILLFLCRYRYQIPDEQVPLFIAHCYRKIIWLF